MTSLQQWTVELVGPKGYIHGWIKVGADIEHKDSSRGRITAYDPNTQTVHADWHAGPRSKVNGGKGTTKAYHLKRESSGAPNADTKSAEVKPVAPASNLTKPTIKNADLLGITIGKKAAVRNLPAGVAVHAIHGSSNSHAVFHNNEHIGYVNKRSGYSTLGRSGAAYMSKNTGYSAYDRRTSRLGDHSTISDAANHVHQSWQRTQGATGPKA